MIWMTAEQVARVVEILKATGARRLDEFAIAISAPYSLTATVYWTAFDREIAKFTIDHDRHGIIDIVPYRCVSTSGKALVDLYTKIFHAAELIDYVISHGPDTSRSPS